MLSVSLISTPVLGFSDNTDNFKLPFIKNCWNLIHHHWSIKGIVDSTDKTLVNNENRNNKLINHAEIFSNLENQMTEKIIKELKNGNTNSLNDLNSFYSRRHASEQVVFTGIYNKIQEFIATEKIKKSEIDVVYIPDGTYLPGYGMTDNNYEYARTDTLETSIVGSYWVDNKFKYLSVNEPFTGTAEISILPQIKKNELDFKTLSETFEVQLGENFVVCQKIYFRSKKVSRYSTQMLYNIIRTEYELWRADKDYIMFPDWERCGQTYELTEKPSGYILLTSPGTK